MGGIDSFRRKVVNVSPGGKAVDKHVDKAGTKFRKITSTSRVLSFFGVKDSGFEGLERGLTTSTGAEKVRTERNLKRKREGDALLARKKEIEDSGQQRQSLLRSS